MIDLIVAAVELFTTLVEFISGRKHRRRYRL